MNFKHRPRTKTTGHTTPDTVTRQLSSIAIVLDHPKDLVNVAGVIRVMKNFGLSDLRLVNPDEFDPYRLEGIAHRTRDLIDSASSFSSLVDAVADATYVVGTTARTRTEGRAYATAGEVAPVIAERAVEGKVAILFGREDRGLTNEDLDRCHAVSIIPTDPGYSSLNLAQAALVIAYEVFLAIEGGDMEMPKGRRATRPPTSNELEETFSAIADGLSAIDFYKARKPEAVMRTLRTIISRAEPDLREARLLAAMGYEIQNYLRRNGVSVSETAAKSRDKNR